MHPKDFLQVMRLVAHPARQAFLGRSIKVVEQDGLVFRMRTFVDDFYCSLARRHPAEIREPVLRDVNIDVVLRLVHVRAHWNDARTFVCVCVCVWWRE